MKKTPSAWSPYHSDDYFKPEYPEYSMFELIHQTALEHPDFYAIEFQNRKTTYAQFIKNIEAVAKALLAHGIKKGDFISIITPNAPQALIMLYAANRIGAVANMIHPLLSATEIKEFVEKVNSVAVLTFDMVYPKLAKIQWSEGKNPTIILARIQDALPCCLKPLYSLKNRLKLQFNPDHKITYWKQYIKEAESQNIILPPDEGKGDDIAVILYSGGTTGIPKGVMIHNRAFNCMALQCSEIKRADDIAGKKGLALMPTFHGFGLAVCMHTMLYHGTQIFMIPKYSFKECSKLIFKKKIGFIYAVPALFEALSRTEEIEKKDLSFIELVAFSGDKCSKKLTDRFNRYLEKGGSEARLQEAYGLTESLSGVCMNPFFALREGSMGIPFADTKMKIVKIGTQETLPPGEDGEICVTGPTLMKGYYKNETETAFALQKHNDGLTWLHTGDIGCVDADGYFYFRQRHCRMIITAGYNVYPTQIEDVISKCNEVSLCCVIGAQDRSIGQRIVAFVQPVTMETDLDALREKILENCRNNMADFAVPQEIFFREALPTTAFGKVNFKMLSDEINKKGAPNND